MARLDFLVIRFTLNIIKSRDFILLWFRVLLPPCLQLCLIKISHLSALCSDAPVLPERINETSVFFNGLCSVKRNFSLRYVGVEAATTKGASDARGDEARVLKDEDFWLLLMFGNRPEQTQAKAYRPGFAFQLRWWELLSCCCVSVSVIKKRMFPCTCDAGHSRSSICLVFSAPGSRRLLIVPQTNTAAPWDLQIGSAAFQAED